MNPILTLSASQAELARLQATHAGFLERVERLQTLLQVLYAA